MCCAWHSGFLRPTRPTRRSETQDRETLAGAALAQTSETMPEALRRPLYVVVEKILGVREALRAGLAGRWHERL